jgi:hypothetical protein
MLGAIARIVLARLRKLLEDCSSFRRLFKPPRHDQRSFMAVKKTLRTQAVTQADARKFFLA